MISNLLPSRAAYQYRGDLIQNTLASYVPVENISKIVIRAYIPGTGNAMLRINLNETSQYYSGQYTGMTSGEYRANAARGSFVDFEIDIATTHSGAALTSGNLHSMNFFIQDGSTAPFYIDYIKVIYK